MKKYIQLLKKGLLIWVILSVIPLVYYFHTVKQSHSFLSNQLVEQGSLFLNYADERAAQLHDRLRNTFRSISRSPLILDFARTQDAELKEYIEDQFKTVSNNSKYFYQIRFIDKTGKEIIRVDKPGFESNAYIVPPHELQDKSHRDYFHYAQTLAPKEQGHFGIDLEYEYNRPVIPYTPGFRLIYPIDYQGQRLGYVIANYFVLNIINYITANHQQYLIDFIDDEGYYLLSTDQNKLFGNLIKTRENFNLASENPTLWHVLISTPQQLNHFVDEKGIYVFKPFNTNLFNASNKLTLLSLIPQSHVNRIFEARDEEIVKTTSYLLIFITFFSIIIAILWDGYNRLKIERAFIGVTLDNSNPVVLTDANHRLLRSNKRFYSLISRNENQAIGYNIFRLFLSKDQKKNIIHSLQEKNQWTGEIDVNDRVYKVEIQALLGSNHHHQNYVYSFNDISEQHNEMIQLRLRSEEDPATGLKNKKRFNEAMEHYAKLKQRYPGDDRESCVVLLDIDDFKNINDTLGHAIGDKVILKLADTLKVNLRTTDLVARIGGDEFGIILQHISIPTAYHLMKRICSEVEQWSFCDATISVGIANITTGAKESYINADKALYRSKRKGKNCVSAHEFESFEVVTSEISRR